MKKLIYLVILLGILSLLIAIMTSCESEEEIFEDVANEDLVENVVPLDSGSAEKFDITAMEIFKEDLWYVEIDEEASSLDKIQPLKISSYDGKVILCNFTPTEFKNVQLYRNDTIIIDDLIINPWTKTEILGAFHGEDIRYFIPKDENPIMEKLDIIDTGFGISIVNLGLNSESTRWPDSVTGQWVRDFFTLSYNMAYFISDPTGFEKVTNDTPILFNEKWSSREKIISKYKTYDKTLICWDVNGVQGMGGKKLLTINGPRRQVEIDRWVKEKGTGTETWLHEFGHVLGIGHNGTSIQYGKGEEYPSLCGTFQTYLIKQWKKDPDYILFPPHRKE